MTASIPTRATGSTLAVLPFDNAAFGTVRALLIDGEPWFVAKDVATALECELSACDLVFSRYPSQPGG